MEKAFIIYSMEERNLRILLAKLQNYGKCNCDIETFAQIYNEWHMQAFPGTKVSTSSANLRNNWFTDFVNYSADRDVEIPVKEPSRIEDAHKK